ncbi:uncharacterized protein LOC132615915 [Lycium barbarum]|uniref:uncharacterized protein LOC132615915 n=1 Tax=Lycium barbarum TaxID=112863 RepID=UPI00293E1FC0|nr:uncharacterized protein LOC132615915 [Lycium barbarum]
MLITLKGVTKGRIIKEAVKIILRINGDLNRDKGQSTEQGSSKLENMLEKVLANQDKADRILKGLIETVGSHTASIQKLKSQMRDIFREQHPPQKGGLLSDTISNLKNGGGGVDTVYAISTQSGKILQSAEKKVINLKPVAEEEEAQSDVPTIVDEVQTEVPIVKQIHDVPVSSKKQEGSTDISKSTVKGALRPLTQLFKATPPFPQRLAKKTEDDKCQSSIISTTNVQKKEDPGAFTVPCYVGQHDFARALCDNGASINLMPLAIYKQLGLGMPRPTTMRLQMVDRSIKRPVAVVDDVLVRVGELFCLLIL